MKNPNQNIVTLKVALFGLLVSLASLANALPGSYN